MGSFYLRWSCWVGLWVNGLGVFFYFVKFCFVTTQNPRQVYRLSVCHLLIEAKRKLQRKKPKLGNYYEILNVSRLATTEEIRKASHKQALKHHPDKHPSACEAEREEQGYLFRAIRAAYTVLSNPNLRERYGKV